jgi:predicted metal-dependent RNase
MKIPVWVDGKLTNTICERYSQILDGEKLSLWQEVKNWSHARYNKEFKGTEKLLSARELGIYISSSGFIQPKTRSCEYVKNFMGSEKSLICFIGYYGSSDSIAGQIVNTPVGQPIKIDGSTIIKNCEVIQFKSFSSHIQRDEIIGYWKQITTDRIIIHHASKSSKDNLMKIGKEELMKIGKTTRISATDKYHSQFVI